MTAPPSPPVLQFPADPAIFRQHDTSGVLPMRVLSGLVEDPSAMGAAATFTLFDETAGSTVAGFPKSATIANPGTDPVTGTFCCDLEMPLQDGSVTANAGRFLGEFTITFPSTNKVILPPDNQLVVIVNADL